MTNKIVIISDTHGYHDHVRVPPCDILIHAGDITNDIGQKSLRDFLIWFERQPAKHKIFIAGNHDGALEKWPDLAKDMIKEYAPSAIYLENSRCEIDGIKFWGCPYSPTFYQWYFMADRGEAIKRYWDMIPADTDVLVSHGPPKDILDVSSYDMKGYGDADLREAVERIKPKLHCFGHFHYPYGTTEKIWDDGKKTIFVNASICDEGYKPVRQPFQYYYET
jgi:Icc-related predicted phosphoesterase